MTNDKQRERLTTDKTKIFVRENITLMSVTKDELRRHYNEIFDRLQEYEVAEETGQIIAPPCKVGDTVWAIIRDTVRECQIHHYKILGETLVVCFEEKAYRGRHYEWSEGYVGVTLFATKEEAEEALRGEGK